MRVALFSFALLVALAGFYWPWLTNQSSFFRNDISAFWHPLVMFNAEAMHNWRLPLWNPYLGCGIPQVAILTPGIFFPPNWLFAWVPFSVSLATVLLVDQLIAALGLLLLVLDLGWGFAPAAWAASTIALNGYFFSTQTSYALNATAAWFPISLWALRRTITSGDQATLRLSLARALPWAAICALCIFMLISAGVPEIFLPALLLLGLYVVVCVVRNRQSGLRKLAIACGAMIFGCLLAMPALLPAAEWAELSKRASGLNLSEVFTWSAGWYELLCLVLPQPFGDITRVDNRFVRLFLPPPTHGPYFAGSYVGAATVTLTWLGCFTCPGRAKRWVLLLLSVSLIAAMGNNTPIAPFIVQHGHFAAFRYPVKLMFFVVLSLSLLSAAGLKGCLDMPDAVGKANLAAVGFWMAGVAASICLMAAPGAFAGFPPFASPDVPVTTSGAAAWRIGNAGLQAAAAGLTICAIVALHYRGKLSARVFFGLALGLQIVLLLSSAFCFHRFPGPTDFYERTSSLKERLIRLNGGTPRGLRVALIQADIRPPAGILDSSNRTLSLHEYNSQMLIPLRNVDFKVASTLTFVVGQTRDMDSLVWTALAAHSAGNDVGLARLCQITSTKFIYTPIHLISPYGHVLAALRLLDQRFFKLVDVDNRNNIRIYAVLNTMPRAYLAKAVKWAQPHAAVVKFVAQQKADAFDPHLLTLLEKNVKGQAAPLVKPQLSPSDWQARVLLDDSEHVVIAASNHQEAYLVLTDLFYPGWQARLDGQLVETWRANVITRAVLLPAGRHIVDFSYQPDSLRHGLWLAGLALVGLLAAVICSFWARLQRPGHEA